MTRNEMTVQALATPARTYALSGVGYSPSGVLSSFEGQGTGLDEVAPLLCSAAVAL